LAGLAAGGLIPKLAVGASAEAMTGRLDQWKSMAGIQGLEPAFEYLSRLDSSSVTPGRTLVVGDDVYAIASTYATKPPEALRFEVHQKYIDVQYVAAGQESIGFLPSSAGLTTLEPYDAAKDIAFYAAPGEYVSLPTKAGQIVVLQPGQPHMPGVHLDGAHDVVKVVVKVSAAWRAARRG
jgi:biofilm protein TabA